MRRAERRSSAPPDKPKPFALTLSGQKGLRLFALNETAEAAGLETGMRLADARTMIPTLRTRTAAPDQDDQALTKLALWCGRFSPWTNVDGTDGLWLDVTGAAHLWGGEEALLKDVGGA